jgi:BlaI family penicillinase repressor
LTTRAASAKFAADAVFAASTAMKPENTLSRRERQIMDVLFQRGSATAWEIRAALPDPPSYSAVRAALSVLQKKGHIRHEIDRLRYVWTPSVERDQARRRELRRVVQTFFEGSVGQTVAALLDERSLNLDERAKERIRALIEKAEASKS